MSRYNTMPYNMSDVLSQQQSNLQHLNSLKNHTKSLTAIDHRPSLKKKLSNRRNEPTSLKESVNFLENSSRTAVNSSVNNSTSFALDKIISSNNNNSKDSNYTYKKENNNSRNKRINSINNNNSLYSKIKHSFQSQNSSNSSKALQKKLQAKKKDNLRKKSDPLVILIPTNAQQTSIIADRFSAWRSIIKSIIIYLNEVASIQDEIVRQQIRLTHAIRFPFFDIENQYKPSTFEDKNIQKFFTGVETSSIQSLPTIFNQYHERMAYNASQMSKELTQIVIPRLDSLREDLLIKIKEIKSLQSDFKNNCDKELQVTKQLMKDFQESIKGGSKIDPCLAKIKLDKQISRQIDEENILHEAFDNLQNSAAELEQVVVMEIQNAITIFGKLMGEQSQIVFDSLIARFDVQFLNVDPLFEWNSFISKNTKNFIQPNLPMRNYKDIKYEHQNDIITKPIQIGYMNKRSKILKSYSKSYYVLTVNYLHEFKSKKDLTPILSIPLENCHLKPNNLIKEKKNGEIDEQNLFNSKEFKFAIQEKVSALITRSQTWNFKCENKEEFIRWYRNLNAILHLRNMEEKIKFIEQERMDKHKHDKKEGTVQDTNDYKTSNGNTKKTQEHDDNPNNSIMNIHNSNNIKNNYGNNNIPRFDPNETVPYLSSITDTENTIVNDSSFSITEATMNGKFPYIYHEAPYNEETQV